MVLIAKRRVNMKSLTDLLLASSQEREKYTANISWAIPSDEAISAISIFVGNETIIEIGAGLGYWAKLLQDKGDRNMTIRSKYIGIIIRGKLQPKTWRNPDNFPEDMREAFNYAKVLSNPHITTAFPVIITQILEEDLQ